MNYGKKSRSTQKKIPKISFTLGLEYVPLENFNHNTDSGMLKLLLLHKDGTYLKKLSKVRLSMVCDIPIAGMNINELVSYTNDIRTDKTIILLFQKAIVFQESIKTLNMPASYPNFSKNFNQIDYNWLDQARMSNNKLHYQGIVDCVAEDLNPEDELLFLNFINNIMDFIKEYKTMGTDALIDCFNLQPLFVCYHYYLDKDNPATLNNVQDFIAHRKQQIQLLNNRKYAPF